MAETVVHEEDAIGKVYDRRLARRLFAYARPYRGLVLAALALLLTDGLLQLAGPLLTRKVIDDALPARDYATVTWATVIYALSLVASFACAYGETLLTSLLGQRIMHDLRMEIFGHLQRLRVAFFDRTPVGRLVTRVTSDVEALNELFTAGVVAGLGDLFTLLAISALMLAIDWQLSLAAFAVIPFVWLTSHIFQRSVRAAYRDIRARLARINAFLQERITGMRVLQLFGRERAEAERFARLNQDHLSAHLRSIRVYALYFPAIEVLTSVALAALIVTGAARVGVGTLTIGTVAAFLQLVRRFFQPLQDLSDKFNTLQQAMAASERVFRLLDEAPGVHDAGRGARDTGRETASGSSASRLAPRARRPGPRERGVTIEFRDVWFHYDRPHGGNGAAAAGAETRPEWVLQGVGFTARPGQTLALVGHTGAGKTTIVNLLLRFYEPQRGRILIDGVDAWDLSLDELRSLIGYVQQDIFLFAGDITTNIRLSAPLSDEAVAEAAARVGADRVIRRFPDGYAHVLGERGATVSVGERQLLSFARAIAADPAVLVLDEATSAVDSRIEAEIQRALAELLRGRTTIAVAHRLSTIVGADEILVLHRGQVRERGTHAELLARRGLYERLYRLQAGTLEQSAGASSGASSVGA